MVRPSSLTLEREHDVEISSRFHERHELRELRERRGEVRVPVADVIRRRAKRFHEPLAHGLGLAAVPVEALHRHAAALRGDGLEHARGPVRAAVVDRSESRRSAPLSANDAKVAFNVEASFVVARDRYEHDVGAVRSLSTPLCRLQCPA